LEALREHPTVAKAIEEIREQTKSEKKRRAMDMREKQLKLLGMKTNNKGQVRQPPFPTAAFHSLTKEPLFGLWEENVTMN
jgi:hypothetical protein